MAVVKGVKERVHLPIYDAISVEPEKQLREFATTGNQLRFFVNVQDKTKLQTNLQSASLLQNYNTFEARALRVVISDLPPEIVEDEEETTLEEYGVVLRDDDGDWPIDSMGRTEDDAGYTEADIVYADISANLTRLWEALEEAMMSDSRTTEFYPDDDEVELWKYDGGGDPVDLDAAEEAEVIDSDGSIFVPESDIIAAIRDLPDKIQPPREQLFRNDGKGTLISKLVYNTVTTLYVGEKVMIQMPTWFFPAGAGPYSESVDLTTHGEPSPMATFRFAEPIFIDRQQNFRVEIEIPDPKIADQIKRLYGPFHIWVVLDGYMTRDVQ